MKFLKVLSLFTLLSLFTTGLAYSASTNSKPKKEEKVQTQKTEQIKPKKYTKKDFSVFEGLRLRDFILSATVYEDKKKSIEYKNDLAKRYKATPSVFSSAVEYGIALIDHGEITEAEKVFNKATEDFYANDTPKVYKGWIYAINGNPVEAKNLLYPIAKKQYDYINAMGSHSLWLPHHVASIVALYLINENLPESDKEEIKLIIEELPKKFGHPNLAVLRVAEDLKNKKLESTAEWLASTLSQFPTHNTTITLLGITQLIIGENEEALKLFNRANEIHPYSPTNHYMKAKALFALKRSDEAMKALDEAIKSDPDWELPKEEKRKYLVQAKN